MTVLTRGWAGLLLLLAPAQETDAKLVRVQRGAIPILLTAPHGGEDPIPGVPERTTGVLLRDTGTREIAEGLARALEEKLGAKPYLVAALFHRKYADANRKEAEAFENAGAKPAYTAYHAAIRESVDEIRKKWPVGAILLDLHGQAADKETVHRGTQNRLTVKALLARQGEKALVGPRSVLGGLAAAGVTVFPAADEKENPRFNGGFTVQTYGSQHEDGVDALQLELGSELRGASREKTVKALAQALAAFHDEYLKAKAPK